MIEGKPNGKHSGEASGINEQETKESEGEKSPRDYRDYHGALKWIQSGLKFNRTADFYEKAVVVCERYSFPEEIRSEVVINWYKELVEEGRIEEAENLREKNEIVVKRFPLTTREYLAKKEALKREERDRIRQAIAEKKNLETTEAAKPIPQLRQAIKDDDLERGLALLGEHPDLTDLFLQELTGLIDKSKKPNQAHRWSEVSNNPAIQRAIFEKLLDYRRRQNRQDLIAEFYHSRDYEIDLIKLEIENIITSGTKDLRILIKMAQIIGGDYEKEIGQRCLEIAQPWENSPNRYERAKYDNLKDIIAHVPYY